MKILDSGEDGGQHYIVMEVVEGQSLTVYLAEAGIEPVCAKSSGSVKQKDSSDATDPSDIPDTPPEFRGG